MQSQVVVMYKGVTLTIPVDVEEITISTKWNGETVVKSSLDVRVVFVHKEKEAA